MDNMLSPKECLYTKFDIDKRVYEITCAIANDYTDEAGLEPKFLNEETQ